MLITRPATTGDADVLASRLREADVREIRAVTDMDVGAALVFSISASEVCEVIASGDDEVVGIYGVMRVPHEPLLGAVWMHATVGLIRHQYTFLKRCRAVVWELNERYPVLFNYVDARNSVHIRWLRWCGFTIINHYPCFGLERQPFYEFVRFNNV